MLQLLSVGSVEGNAVHHLDDDSSAQQYSNAQAATSNAKITLQKHAAGSKPAGARVEQDGSHRLRYASSKQQAAEAFEALPVLWRPTISAPPLAVRAAIADSSWRGKSFDTATPWTDAPHLDLRCLRKLALPSQKHAELCFIPHPSASTLCFPPQSSIKYSRIALFPPQSLNVQGPSFYMRWIAAAEKLAQEKAPHASIPCCRHLRRVKCGLLYTSSFSTSSCDYV